MSSNAEMMDLLNRAETERRLLADAVGAVRDEIDSRRREWRLAGLAAGALFGMGSMAYKLFGKSSPFSRIGRAGSVASLLLGLTRAAMRWRKFF
ncbi:MAG TPA: hypothetical protein VK780_07780 [Thermoanaerobaculia bacterium]|jgi:hypothetical protein|nr:hypothetical protein [Thermoanaerobaculia bacterium]